MRPVADQESSSKRDRWSHDNLRQSTSPSERNLSLDRTAPVIFLFAILIRVVHRRVSHAPVIASLKPFP